jgi:hypothetical protein
MGLGYAEAHTHTHTYTRTPHHTRTFMQSLTGVHTLPHTYIHTYIHTYNTLASAGGLGSDWCVTAYRASNVSHRKVEADSHDGQCGGVPDHHNAGECVGGGTLCFVHFDALCLMTVTMRVQTITTRVSVWAVGRCVLSTSMPFA